MMTLEQVLNAKPEGLIVGVVEFEDSKMIGILNDPMELDPSITRLAYALEVKVGLPFGPEKKVNIAFIMPELGIPEEFVTNAGTVSIYANGCAIAGLYSSALKKMVAAGRMNYEPSIAYRQPATR